MGMLTLKEKESISRINRLLINGIWILFWALMIANLIEILTEDKHPAFAIVAISINSISLILALIHYILSILIYQTHIDPSKPPKVAEAKNVIKPTDHHDVKNDEEEKKNSKSESQHSEESEEEEEGKYF